MTERDDGCVRWEVYSIAAIFVGSGVFWESDFSVEHCVALITINEMFNYSGALGTGL